MAAESSRPKARYSTPQIRHETLEFCCVAAYENRPATGFYGQAGSRFTDETGSAIQRERGRHAMTSIVVWWGVMLFVMDAVREHLLPRPDRHPQPVLLGWNRA